MAISEVVNNVNTVYICKNVDTKPVGAIPNSMLWVYDVNTYFWTPDGYIWIQTQGNNSIFSKP